MNADAFDGSATVEYKVKIKGEVMPSIYVIWDFVYTLKICVQTWTEDTDYAVWQFVPANTNDTALFTLPTYIFGCLDATIVSFNLN